MCVPCEKNQQQSGQRSTCQWSRPQFQLPGPRLTWQQTGVNEPLGLVQTRVLVFRLFQGGKVGVGVFPESEQVLIGGACTGCVSGEGERAGQLKLAEKMERGEGKNRP